MFGCLFGALSQPGPMEARCSPEPGLKGRRPGPSFHSEAKQMHPWPTRYSACSPQTSVVSFAPSSSSPLFSSLAPNDARPDPARLRDGEVLLPRRKKKELDGGHWIWALGVTSQREVLTQKRGFQNKPHHFSNPSQSGPRAL